MENTEARELRLIRTVKAPIDLVWKVWTDSEHIVNWWGPHGHTNTIHKMDFTEGGEWKLTMQGPDGTKYPKQEPLHRNYSIQENCAGTLQPSFHCYSGL